MRSIDDILNELDELIDHAWTLPLSGGRSVVDVEKVRELIDDVRLGMPAEIKNARMIVSDRTDIIAAARKESESIIRRAEERARALIDEQEIVRQASQKAAEIVGQAQLKAREMRTATTDFSEAQLKRAEDALLQSYNDVKNARISLKKPNNG